MRVRLGPSADRVDSCHVYNVPNNDVITLGQFPSKEDYSHM